MGYSSWVHKESNMACTLSLTHTHTQFTKRKNFPSSPIYLITSLFISIKTHWVTILVNQLYSVTLIMYFAHIAPIWPVGSSS